MRNTVRAVRESRDWSQSALAREIGVSRQALHGIETGAAQPGVGVALRLGAALAVPVEQLFGTHARLGGGKRARSGSRVTAQLSIGPLAAKHGSRVVLAQVRGAWVAHVLGPREQAAADGLIHRVRNQRAEVEVLNTLERARRRLVVMGCAPALGLLASRLGDEVPLTWLQGGSSAALEALARGEVHIAGVHHANVAPHAPVAPKTVMVTLAGWELGLVVARGNPKRLRSLADLSRAGVRVVMREAGSRAQALLEASPRFSRVRCVQPVASGHLELAERVALGLGDCGITIGSAAIAFGLDFVPLVEERFELVIPRRLVGDERVERMIDVLASRPFRTELDSVGGYFTSVR
ncbi:MAG: substrate-binding domain-containing protein [Archangium sp.]